MGTSYGRRSASAPRGTAKGPGRIMSGPHVARSGPKAVTGTEVTASRRRERGEESNGHVRETANGPWGSSSETPPPMSGHQVSLSHPLRSLSVERRESESASNPRPSYPSYRTENSRSGAREAP